MSEAFRGHATEVDVQPYAAPPGRPPVQYKAWPRDRAEEPEDSYTDLVLRLGQARRRGYMLYSLAALACLGWWGLLAANVVADGGDLVQALAGAGPMLLMTAAGPAVLAFAVAALMSRLGKSDAYILALSRATGAFMRPDERAAEQIVSVSHVVRREIAAMADGLERAFSRTAELESVVRNEIVRLERAFSENERRIGGLLRQLESERNAVMRHADALKTALPLFQAASAGAVGADAAGAGAQRARLLGGLQADTERLSQEVASAVAESAGHMLNALRLENEKALSVVMDAVRRLERNAAVAQPGGDLTAASMVALEAVAREASDTLAREVRDAIAALSEEMTAKAQELGGMRAGLAAVLDRSRHEFTRALAQTAREASAEITAAHREARVALEKDIVDATAVTAGARTGGVASGSLSTFTTELAAVRQLLEETGEGRIEEIRGQLAEHAARIEKLVSGSVTQVNEGVAERLKALQATLFEQKGGLAERFDHSHGAVVERLQEVSESIDELVQNSLAQAQATAEQLSSLVDTLGLVARARRESPAREGAAFIARERPLITPRRTRGAEAAEAQLQHTDAPAIAPGYRENKAPAASPAAHQDAQEQGERSPAWLSDLLSRGPKV